MRVTLQNIRFKKKAFHLHEKVCVYKLSQINQKIIFAFKNFCESTQHLRNARNFLVTKVFNSKVYI